MSLNPSKPVPTTKSAPTPSSGGSGNPRVLKTGMIMKKKPVMETKGVRDDIEEEDSEESYYRYFFS